ncbi:MAG: S-layer homology domain-containing protein [Clostridia bacterium]|nr:S-layer homology domain-containing protein [Clostridia bacterium]
MKKFLMLISVVLAAIMLLPLASFAAKDDGDLPFSDVKNGAWYYGDVKRVYESKFMNGTSDTEFDPEGTLTRGMCAAIIYRASGEPEVKGAAAFADVDAGAYYADAVAWAQNEKIVMGKSATIFDPDGNITRAEFSTMLYRYLDAADLALPEVRGGEPTDASDVPEYAGDAVSTMYRAEVVNGRENGQFDPDADITRAETAAMVDRFLEKAKSITSDDGFGIRVDFDVPDAEEGFFRGGRISDVTVGYVPEGLNLYEVEDTGSEDIRTLRLSTAYDLESITQPFVLVEIYTSSEIKPGWGYKTYEHVYLGELNGMDAYVYENSGESGGVEFILTGIMFGDKDVTVNVFGMNVSHEEVWRIAESIAAAPAE